MPSTVTPGQISDQTWEEIRTEFTLPRLEQVHRRLSELTEDPEPLMQQLVRVFIDDGTFCPGFQFLAGGSLHPTVVGLFQRAMELNVPHNYFTVWMVTPSRDLGGGRPVDLLRNRAGPLPHALDAFGARLARKP
ncbi:hypothetical protein [Arthrobacter oryzae]|uniref:hypothetical protein n=1 Tax=Arthrobacter oryzae TaxID=409290 RepID=UPI002864EBB9|nr:hypothetical protein [Arthrobacter oryzae]MDR6508110.1 hypothetical protein [Arthrobacter oryzae]